MIKKFSKNDKGRDLIVGDIHGCFTRLEKALGAIGFDEGKDRLFSVGDLVDRGPECELVVDWLNKPWFHAVRGNHEDYVCRYETVDIGNWLMNGGGWFISLPSEEQRMIAEAVRLTPYAIELETTSGIVGIVHADAPCSHWAQLPEMLVHRNGRDYCMWSRSRIENENDLGVQGVRAVVVGHTPLREVRVLGNVMHIDTGGWIGVEGGNYHFTILDADTLRPASAA